MHRQEKHLQQSWDRDLYFVLGMFQPSQTAQWLSDLLPWKIWHCFTQKSWLYTGQVIQATAWFRVWRFPDASSYVTSAANLVFRAFWANPFEYSKPTVCCQNHCGILSSNPPPQKNGMLIHIPASLMKTMFEHQTPFQTNCDKNNKIREPNTVCTYMSTYPSTPAYRATGWCVPFMIWCYASAKYIWKKVS